MKTIMINTRYLEEGIKKQKPELALYKAPIGDRLNAIWILFHYYNDI